VTTKMPGSASSTVRSVIAVELPTVRQVEGTR
jgi:hypothetical protein